MGGPSGSSGTPSNSSGKAVSYQPTAQPQSDALYQALLGGFAGSLSPAFGNQFSTAFGIQPTQNPFSSTPGGVSYGMAAPFVGGAGSGTITDPNSPSYLQALQGALTAAGSAGNVLGAGGAIPTLAEQAFDQASTAINSADPAILAALGETGTYNINNAQLQSQNLGALASQLGNQNFSNVANLAPIAGGTAGNIMLGVGGALPAAVQAASQGAGNLNTYANQILGTAFDPQNALYNQLQNQTTQQAEAAAAAAGLGGSAYGASTVGNTLNNFNINWQNQQLARQAQGLSSAQPAYTTAAQLPFAPGAAAAQTGTAASQYAAAPLQLGGAIGQVIANLNQTANQLPYSVMSALSGLGGSVAGQQFTPGTGLAGLVGQAPGLLQAGSTLAGTPYNTLSTQANNALSALGNYTNIGNQQYVVPQQLSNDLQSYLQLGQAASGLSGQLGALGQQELGSSLSGIGSALGTGSNLLFGNQGLSGALGLGSSGLLGGALGGGSATSSALTDIGAIGGAGGGAIDSGVLAAAPAAATGGGFSLGSLLPFGAAS